MRIRNVLQEYEAKLEPKPASPCPGARGKAEWKVYGNGVRQAKVSVSKVDLPDEAVVELVLEKKRLAQITVEGGRVRYRRETERGEDVLFVEVNQVLQVIYAGQVLLAGLFYSE